MPVEIWKDISGYEGWYQVSNLGRVKRLRKVHYNHGIKNIVVRDYILKSSKDLKGYSHVALRKDGYNKKTFKVHRLVAMAFIPNPLNKPQVDHINRNPNDNRVENLRWVTNGENQLNTTQNVLLEYKGETKPLAEWGRIKGKNPCSIKRRLDNGWSVEDALDKPIDTRFYRKSLMEVI